MCSGAGRSTSKAATPTSGTSRTRTVEQSLGREPTHEELAEGLKIKPADLTRMLEGHKRDYRNGGFKVYDVSDRAKPRLIAYQRTGGIGVHRFDMDANHAYISTEMEGYVGNILVIYDIRKPAEPAEVSRWWLPGQHVAGGEKPAWPGRRHRLHHALRRGDRLWAAVWQGGMRVIDSPYSRTAGGRFGAHQFHEHPVGTLVFATWFSGGLRIIDLADPSAPREAGHYIPEPVGGRALPQSNDVFVDARGLVYLQDRFVGLDILEYRG
jgi:hypothetical protein